jgi:acyl carrier protein
MEPIAETIPRPEATSIKAVIRAQFDQVAKEQERELPPLADDLVLTELDLDSLCFAIIVARLEDVLGFDPFSVAEEVTFPVTLGEFVRFYEIHADAAG